MHYEINLCMKVYNRTSYTSIIGVARTPMGSFLGSLSSLPGTNLGSNYSLAALFTYLCICILGVFSGIGAIG